MDLAQKKGFHTFRKVFARKQSVYDGSKKDCHLKTIEKRKLRANNSGTYHFENKKTPFEQGRIAPGRGPGPGSLFLRPPLPKYKWIPLCKVLQKVLILDIK